MAASVLLLGTAEWDAPIATNQHYVARELARTADVYFVESLGLRRPTLRRDDVVRMYHRLRRAVGAAPPAVRRPRPDRTRILSPVLVPLHRAPTRALNRGLLRHAATLWIHSGRLRVLWAFSPVTYGLEAAADVVVYHCVDLLGAFPGVDAVAVERGERRLAARAAFAIATSSTVAAHLHRLGFRRVELLPNVADVSTFTGASRPAGQRGPTVLFSGNLTEHKLDAALLEAVAGALRGRGELVLAGPVNAGGGDFSPALRRLLTLGARYVGTLGTGQLAELAGTCRVGLIPYAINDYTRGVSPLKCYEYLASGLAVVGTRLPEVARLAAANEHVVVADPAELPAQVLRLLESPTDEEIRDRVEAAARHGWDERGRTIRALLAAESGAWSGCGSNAPVT